MRIVVVAERRRHRVDSYMTIAYSPIPRLSMLKVCPDARQDGGLTERLQFSVRFELEQNIAKRRKEQRKADLDRGREAAVAA